MEWTHWHKLYATTPALQERLQMVCARISAALDACPAGPVRIASICAGDGRDLIGALSGHPRKNDVTAALLDAHAPSLARGAAMALEAGLSGRLQFLEADATAAGNYAGIAPVHLLLMSGFLGHLPHEEVPRLIENLPMLCAPGAWVVWSRHMRLHDGEMQVPLIRELFSRADFEEIDFEAGSSHGFAVGRARFHGAPVPLDASRTLFHFAGIDQFPALAGRQAEIPNDGRGKGGGAGLQAAAEQSIPACFAQIVARQPDDPAIHSAGWQPAYGGLDAAANSLAHRLMAGGGTLGERVVLLMRHDAPLIAAMLGVLKAGMIFVVLHPGDPGAGLARVLDEVEPRFIVSDAPHRALAEKIAPRGTGVVGFEEQADGPAHDPEIEIPPGAPACLIYTSGSTGRPRGVIQTHRNIIHNVSRLSRGLGIAPRDRITLFASPGGGQGLSTTWCALLNGALLCPFPIAEKGLAGAAAWLRTRRISVLIASASLFRNLLRTLEGEPPFPDVRVVRLCSESATANDFAACWNYFSKDCFLLHTLSSSEAGNISQMRLCKGDQVAAGNLPLGFPADGVEILLLDETGGEVPSGGTGEIAIRSRYLSPGYWRDESLTAKRFSGSPVPDDARIYRSGDLGRYLPDGTLEYQGRKDAQVKHHGYRVQLSEVERALAGVPGVEQAVVCATLDQDGGSRLVAYVLRGAGRAVTAASLRNALRPVLPGHMLPSGFVFPAQFPLTPHGKVGREALQRSLPENPEAPASDAAPATDTERWLAGVWQKAFVREAVGRFDDFFDLGGDSLGAAVVSAQVHARHGIELPLSTFTSHPALADLARVIDEIRVRESPDVLPGITRIPRDRPLPLSFEQERTWNYSQTPAQSAGYVVTATHRIRGPLDIPVLRASMDYIARRHEILRTTFDVVEGRPAQIVHPDAPVPLTVAGVSGTPDPEAAAELAIGELSRHPFDLRTGPLLRFLLVKIRAGEHWLVRANHHINSDGWSWKIYFNELALVYQAKRKGMPPPLPEAETLQYADYAAWQRRTLDPASRAYAGEIEWWKKELASRAEPPDLPFARPAAAPCARPGEGLVSRSLDDSISRRLDMIARQEFATYYTVRLAAFAALIAAESSRPDVTLGIYLTNRNTPEAQNLFGFFSNLATLRLQCDPTRTFREWLGAVKNRTEETQAHGRIPYEMLCEELRNQNITMPEIRAIFTVSDQNAPVSLGDAEISWVGRRTETQSWGFTVTFDANNAPCALKASFDARIYDPARVDEWMDRYTRLLDAVSQSPHLALNRLLEVGGEL